jgi:hypothetical protein
METKVCTKCSEAKPLEEFRRDKKTQSGRTQRCKPCLKHYEKQWYAINREAKLKENAAWRSANAHRMAEYTRRHAALYPEKVYARVRRWQVRHRERINAWASERRALEKQACPAWADRDAIQQFYSLAIQLSTSTGVPHEVDHIVPLVNRHVCGLHVAANLRVIPATENRRKSNKFTTSME